MKKRAAFLVLYAVLIFSSNLFASDDPFFMYEDPARFYNQSLIRNGSQKLPNSVKRKSRSFLANFVNDVMTEYVVPFGTDVFDLGVTVIVNALGGAVLGAGGVSGGKALIEKGLDGDFPRVKYLKKSAKYGAYVGGMLGILRGLYAYGKKAGKEEELFENDDDEDVAKAGSPNMFINKYQAKVTIVGNRFGLINIKHEVGDLTGRVCHLEDKIKRMEIRQNILESEFKAIQGVSNKGSQ